MLRKIENHENLVKDSDSGAILLNNRNIVDEYKARKKLINQNRSLEQEINIIKHDLQELSKVRDSLEEIKEMLKGLSAK